MQVKIAILLTRTMDTIRVRVPFPTFSWEDSHNGGLSTTWPAAKHCLTLWHKPL